MARVSYLRPPVSPDRARPRASRPRIAGAGRRLHRFGRGPLIAAGLLLIAVVAFAAAALVLETSHATIEPDGFGLARIALPTGGGRIISVTVTTGPHSRPVPAELRGQTVWPRQRIGVHQFVTVEAVVRRPGWIAWLSGRDEHVRLRLLTPSAHLVSHYLTLHAGAPITLHFREPIQAIAYGPAGQIVHRDLVSPLSVIHLNRTAVAGTLSVAAMPRTWESAPAAVVSWFPAGTATGAVASPAPGSRIGPHTRLTLTFSKPWAQALGHSLPPVTPAGAGTWQPINSHTIAFVPTGFGYGLGTKVGIGLPAGVQLVGGAPSWTVPGGTTLRLQQLLADLGYLPLRFTAHASVAGDPAAQEQAAIHPPAGDFTWRYANIPAALRGFWSPGSAGVMTQGALMAFENDHGLTTDGVAGPSVWKALLGAAVHPTPSSFGYTFVQVSLSDQSLDLWHNGQTVLTTAVNTGIASQPTNPGTFAVYEHLRVTTMSGTNPDGSTYNDPGIQFVSYFNGGDALHAFTRAQYGFPQSLGCVEMPLGPAGQVWPYTPIGTLVHVA